MRLRSLIVAVMAALTLVAGAAAGVSTAANAAAAATSTASKIQLATPDVNGDCRLVTPPVSGSYLELFNGYNYSADEWLCGCNPGTTYYNVLDPIKSFVNNCDNKAWLQYSNGTSYCISELEYKADVGSKYQDPVSELLGRETGDC